MAASPQKNTCDNWSIFYGPDANSIKVDHEEISSTGHHCFMIYQLTLRDTARIILALQCSIALSTPVPI